MARGMATRPSLSALWLRFQLWFGTMQATLCTAARPSVARIAAARPAQQLFAARPAAAVSRRQLQVAAVAGVDNACCWDKE
jgi:hypothetical protein